MADISITTLPELVRDSQLQVRFESEGQQHFTIHMRSSRRGSTQEKWVSMRRLGYGGQGVVDLQIRQDAQGGQPQLRAVKTLHIPENSTHSGQKWYKRELETIAKFSQAKYSYHFVKSFGWFVSPGCIHIAMEYCEFGDLENYCLNCPNHRLPEEEVHGISSQVLDAVHSMHAERFCHRDLKLANILIMSVNPSWWVKLADFGQSKRDEVVTQTISTTYGTIRYMPPELHGYTGSLTAADPYPVDMWCLGQSVFRLATGRFMFPSVADLAKYYYGQVAFPEELLRQHQDIDENLIIFIKSLVCPEPVERLSSKEALSHPWILGTKEYTTPSDSTYSPFPEINLMQGDYPIPPDTWSSEEIVPASRPNFDSQEPSAAWTTEEIVSVSRVDVDLQEPSAFWLIIETAIQIIKRPIRQNQVSTSRYILVPAATRIGMKVSLSISIFFSAPMIIFASGTLEKWMHAVFFFVWGVIFIVFLICSGVDSLNMFIYTFSYTVMLSSTKVGGWPKLVE